MSFLACILMHQNIHDERQALIDMCTCRPSGIAFWLHQQLSIASRHVSRHERLPASLKCLSLNRQATFWLGDHKTPPDGISYIDLIVRQRTLSQLKKNGFQFCFGPMQCLVGRFLGVCGENWKAPARTDIRATIKKGLGKLHLRGECPHAPGQLTFATGADMQMASLFMATQRNKLFKQILPKWPARACPGCFVSREAFAGGLPFQRDCNLCLKHLTH